MLRRQFMQLLGFSLVGPLFTRKAIAQIPPKKIVLQEVYVAGYQYHEGMKRSVEAALDVGQELHLVREPNNQYDGNAIAVKTASGHMLGYLPRDVNEIPATLCDQDIKIRAEITALHLMAPTWERLAIRSYMVA